MHDVGARVLSPPGVRSAGFDAAVSRLIGLLELAAAPAAPSGPARRDRDLCVREIEPSELGKPPPAGRSRVVTFVRLPWTREGVAEITASPLVDPRLHGARVPVGAPLPGDVPGTPLARSGTASWWLRLAHGRTVEDVIAAPMPVPTAARRLLGERIDTGTLPLLALVHVLREGSPAVAPWQQTARACLMVDDPNLRSFRYGHLDFRALSDFLAERSLHLNVATIPIDAWGARRAVVEHFRRAPWLSVSVHGNRHLRREMAAVSSSAEAEFFAHQALARTRRLGRLGLDVEPVMVPPHGACSELMMQGAAAAGVEGICYTGPVGARSAVTTVGLYPADVDLPGSLPGLARFAFRTAVDEIRVRAFLGQPIVLYGHQEDFADGLGVLETAAGAVASVGETRWMSPLQLLRTNVWTVRHDGVESGRAWSRRVAPRLDEDVECLRLTWPSGATTEVSRRAGPWPEHLVLSDPVWPRATGDRAQRVDRRLPYALVRRVATETRDRSRRFTGARLVRRDPVKRLARVQGP